MLSRLQRFAASAFVLRGHATVRATSASVVYGPNWDAGRSFGSIRRIDGANAIGQRRRRPHHHRVVDVEMRGARTRRIPVRRRAPRRRRIDELNETAILVIVPLFISVQWVTVGIGR